MRNVKVYQELSQDASMFLGKQGVSKYKYYSLAIEQWFISEKNTSSQTGILYLKRYDG